MPQAATIGTTTTIDPNFQVTTKEQAFDLDRAFDEAFGPLEDLAPRPAKTEGAPKEAPKEETAVEAPPKEEPKPEERPGEEPPETEPKPEGEGTVQPEPKEGEGHPDDQPDEELDKFQLHHSTRPEDVHAFRELRGLLKKEKRFIRELQERVGKQDQELTGLRGTARPVSDPAVQQELEYLRSFRTKHQIFDDSTYQTQFEQPVRAIFDDIVRDVKAIAQDPAAAEEWEKQIRAAGPDRLDRNYWIDGVINQCQDPLHKERLVRKISFLHEAEEKRNQFRDQMSAQPAAYDQFVQQQAADYWQNFSTEAGDEAQKIIPTLGEWANKKDVALAKTAQERAAAEAHNKGYEEHEKNFKNYLTDAATNGPRGMTRVAVAAVLGVKYKKDLDAANARLTKLSAELKAAQDELAKISTVRNRVNQSSGSSSRSTAPPQKLSKTVEEAFKEFFPS